ncbi:MAG: hypothetical protein Kow0068_03910 [Marinilabiliales bacterium]
MNKIEDLIKNYSELLNSELPRKEHLKNMNRKIRNLNGKNIYISNIILKYAAIVILLALSLYGSFKLFTRSQKQNYTSIFPDNIQLLPEYAEAEIYYTSQINEKISFINTNTLNDSLTKEIFTEEMKEMDKFLNDIKTELNTNPNDERVLNAVISYYQLKLNVLNKILNQLKTIEQINFNNYEKTEL